MKVQAITDSFKAGGGGSGGKDDTGSSSSGGASGSGGSGVDPEYYDEDQPGILKGLGLELDPTLVRFKRGDEERSLGQSEGPNSTNCR